MESYDPALDEWQALAPMATKRCELGTCVQHGKLYAVGGYNGGDRPLSTAERFDPATNVWEEVASMATARIRPVVALL